MRAARNAHVAVEIDGAEGEGGGQVLRTALALSAVTGRPFEIHRIRAGRERPGLLRQHLTAVEAMAQVASAAVDGAHLGSDRLSFSPGAITGGTYRFAIGTAGSATLVLQTLLPALLAADAPSEVSIEGGTHNPLAPPYAFMAKSYLPVLGRMGAAVALHLERHGFYPAGGGCLRAEVQPCEALRPVEITERGEILRRRAEGLVCCLPRHIAERELAVVASGLAFSDAQREVVEMKRGACPGNVLTVELEGAWGTAVFTGFGQHGVAAERVAQEVVDEVKRYLAAHVPVEAHLADQLLVPMALAGGGAFRTTAPSQHLLTNARIIEHFLPVSFTIKRGEGAEWQVSLASSASVEA